MFTIPENLTYVSNRDGALILDKPKNAMTPLNSTGAYIWQRLEQGTSPDDIVNELASETESDPKVVAADVNLFLEDLKSQGLLREV
jgi:hypothetical protein